MPFIDVQGLTKQYGSSIYALHDVSLTVERALAVWVAYYLVWALSLVGSAVRMCVSIGRSERA